MNNRWWGAGLFGIVMSVSGAQAAPSQDTQAHAYDEGFSLPSGRLQCAFSLDGELQGRPAVRCEVLNASYKAPPRPTDCPLAWGDALEVESSGKAQFLCHGDTVMNPPGQRAILAYGQTWKRSGITCSSSTAGVRCLNADGHGFELARARYRTF
ncbi:DUF6636 domain-containing protein [Deinococcus sp.]|uniref:DUF6636 domain-containing protein n=1 Tax=Deinococcus sp. TaxID=47478 RepID=UPI003CC59A31